MLYKILYRDGAYHVIPATETTLLGYEIRPYGSLADCLERAELRATQHARRASGGAKGRRFVRQTGMSFEIVKAEQSEGDD